MNRGAIPGACGGIKNLSVYYGQTPALTDVCLDVSDGEYLGILGPNGGGKSTLLKAILGLVPVSSGSVRIYGKKPGEIRKAAGYVPQTVALAERQISELSGKEFQKMLIARALAVSPRLLFWTSRPQAWTPFPAIRFIPCLRNRSSARFYFPYAPRLESAI